MNLGRKSTTVRSYYSALKAVLHDDGYKLNKDTALIHTITRACKLTNDIYIPRLPITDKMLENILFEVERTYKQQPYPCTLYKAIFAIAYYGLLCIGEVTKSDHVIQARDINIATNKQKILIYLFSSKTHRKESRPQKVKIAAIDKTDSHFRHFCPFEILQNCMKIQGDYETLDEQFFVFPGNIPVEPDHICKVLKEMIKKLGLNPNDYVFHSMRAGRASDMAKMGIHM